MRRVRLFSICTVVCLLFFLLLLTGVTGMSKVRAADGEISPTKKIISVTGIINHSCTNIFNRHRSFLISRYI